MSYGLRFGTVSFAYFPSNTRKQRAGPVDAIYLIISSLDYQYLPITCSMLECSCLHSAGLYSSAPYNPIQDSTFISALSRWIPTTLFHFIHLHLVLLLPFTYQAGVPCNLFLLLTRAACILSTVISVASGFLSPRMGTLPDTTIIGEGRDARLVSDEIPIALSSWQWLTSCSQS